MENKDTIGSFIKEKRKLAKMTQKELARRIGKVESTVRMWELGKNKPLPDVLKKLSVPLDVSYDQLMLKAGYIDPDLNLGQLIKNRREKKEMTTEQLATEINFPLSKLNEVENGELIPSSQTLKNISEALDMDYAEMMKKAGFWDEDENFIDPFNKIAKERKRSLTFEVPAMEVIESETGTVTREISDEEAYRRFLELENLLTMEHPIYLNGKKLSTHQRNQILQTANIVFGPSQEEE